MKAFFAKRKLILVALALIAVCATLLACGKPSSTQTPCNVNFMGEDGNFLYATVVDYNTVPVYAGVTPEKAQTEAEVFEFIGWTANGKTYETLPRVTKNTVFTATFAASARKYAITFVVDGAAYIRYVAYGTTPS